MKSKMTKLAAAAAIIVIVVLGVTFLDKAVKPAWAIEDTIKALEHIYSIKMSGTAIEENCEKEYGYVLWAKPDEDGTESGELRFEVPDQLIIVVVPSGITYTYQPQKNTVYVAQGKNFTINPWPDSKFFNQIKRFTENWQVSYGKDEKTEKQSIFVTCVHPYEAKSWWVQFDSETKLPVRLKQWMNNKFEGKPQFYAAEIEYNAELPAGILKFEIPQGAEVVKTPPKLPEYLNDPNVGLSTEGLTDEQACLTIIEDYWQAIIDGDWRNLAQLRPICNAENWELKFKRNESWPTEIIEIGQPYKEAGCNIGPVVPCTIKYSGGQIKNIKMIVKIRNTGESKTCVIAGTYGDTKDFER